MSDPRRGGPTPLYHQIYVLLRQMLTEGEWPADAKLPSEPALAARYGVSRVTVRSTLARLEAEGLVRRVRGVGTFTAGPPARDGPTNISGLLENLISVDASTTAETLSWGLVTPEPAVARLILGVCLKIVRLRSHRGQAISLTTLHLPEPLARLLDRATLGDEPVVRVLDRQGVIAVHAEQTITAVAAEPATAAALGVPTGSPLISMRRLMVDASRAPVLHQESLYAPDRFEYRMTLSRTALGTAPRWTPVG
jgi:GntR family transcriptional regulator